MTDDQRAMYAAVTTIRNNEVTLRWTRTQLFFLIHSASLSFAGTQLILGTRLFTAVCVVGFILSILWLLATKRIGHWVNYWNSRLVALENVDSQPVRIFGGREYERAVRGFTVHWVLLALVVLFMAIWGWLTVVSILRATGRW